MVVHSLNATTSQSLKRWWQIFMDDSKANKCNKFTNMIIAKRTNSKDNDFQVLVRELDLDLKIRDGEEHLFYAQLNKTDKIKYVIMVYDQDEPIGCGAVREYAADTMEVKRMFVQLKNRGQGIASIILKELETWCKELNFKKCILETGKNQPEALRLYTKNNYTITPNFGHYKNVTNSVCFEKELTIDT